MELDRKKSTSDETIKVSRTSCSCVVSALAAACSQQAWRQCRACVDLPGIGERSAVNSSHFTGKETGVVAEQQRRSPGVG